MPIRPAIRRQDWGLFAVVALHLLCGIVCFSLLYYEQWNYVRVFLLINSLILLVTSRLDWPLSSIFAWPESEFVQSSSLLNVFRLLLKLFIFRCLSDIRLSMTVLFSNSDSDVKLKQKTIY